MTTPGLWTATMHFFRAHVGRVARSRRTLACAALAAGPPLLAWTIAHYSRRIPAESVAVHVGWLLLIQVVTPLCALVLGSAVLAEEIEDRTISYLLSRPIPRASILLGRWLAVLAAISALLGTSALLTALAALHSSAAGPAVDRGIAVPLLAATLSGGAVYSALFAGAGVVFRHPMIAGLGYAFAIEGFLANLPGKNQALTIQYYLRSLIAAHGSAAWANVEGFASTRFETAGASVVTLAALLGGVLALASWRIGRREYVVGA